MAKPKIFRVQTSEDAWYKFLEITNNLQPKDKRLSAKEMEILAYICTQNPDKPQLNGIFLNNTLIKFPTLSRSHVGVLKHSLQKKGWMSNGLLTNWLRSQLQYLWQRKHDSPHTELELSFKITTKTSTEELYG